jgi:HD-like signal output (HDOD) protein
MTEAVVPAAFAEEEAARLARDLGIPPCPAILLRFSDEMHKNEPDLRRLASFIGNDVALSAAMLSAVNSPLYGLSRKAGNVQQALSILGLRAGANLVTALLLRNAFPSSSGALMQRFWEDSAQLADTAADIARGVHAVNRDDAHTYALFRDCGMAVMIGKFRDYAQVLDLHASRPSPELILAEEARYRFNHARVGYALARGWLLPEPLCKSILFHHNIAQVAAGVAETEAADPSLVAFGLLAEQVFSLRSGRGLRPDWAASEAFVLHALRLTPEQIVAMGAPEAVAA